MDISVQVFMGALCYITGNPWCTTTQAPVGYVKFTDGSPQSAVNDFDQTFPYLKTPIPGYTDGEAITNSPASTWRRLLCIVLLRLF